MVLGPDGEPLPSAPPSQPFVSRYAYIALPEAAKGAATSTDAGSTARQYPKDTAIGDAYFYADQQKRMAGPASANKLGEAKAPAITLQGITTIQGDRKVLTTANLAPATPPASPQTASQRKLLIT